MTENTTQPNHNRYWRIQPKIPHDIDLALRDFPPLLRQLLYNRGIFNAESAASFINGELPFSNDPFQIKDMHTAVERIHTAIFAGEKIAIYGDYDADGVTATALMFNFLHSLAVEPLIYIPNRFDEGYGLNEEAIHYLVEMSIDLIITVDCGIRSISEVTLAKDLGMDMIITDHHQPGKELPPALAVINPKQLGDPYPEKDLAGVGLAYKLAQAYLTAHPQPDVDPEDWLDLVAIGTVADMAPLTGENRMLVKKGLTHIRQRPRLGLNLMARVAGLDLTRCDASMIGFGLAPRLNAAGRMDTAMSAYEILVTQDQQRAGELAQVLDSHNNQRQEETHTIRKKALDQVLQKDPEALLFFATDSSFSEGLVGLAASRLTDIYYRPAIIAHQGEEFTVASCRSIPEFHITEALDECADLLVRYGGHAAAAGFTVSNENLPMLIEKLDAIVQRELDGVDLMPVIEIDREILLEKLTSSYIGGIFNDLHQLQPTGIGNPEPIFASNNVIVHQVRTVGQDGKHLKLTIKAGDNYFDAIAFQQGHRAEGMPRTIDIAYRFEENVYMGRTNLQLNIKDFRSTLPLEEKDISENDSSLSN